jgi:Uma2 family endonuclease
MDDVVVVKPHALTRMTFAAFTAFYDQAPPDARWELIDGEAIEMAPAKKLHQRIAGSIKDLINARLQVVRPDWYADQEIGVRDVQIDTYASQPDVTVGDRDFPIDQIWSERFYFVVEVLSDDRADVLEKKRAFYKAHGHCRGFLFVSQKEIRAELVVRAPDGWLVRELSRADDSIEIPDIGLIGRLGQAYRATPLLPST